MITLSALLMGVGTYLVTEFFSWIERKATGTPFEGKAAWLVVAVVSLAVGFTKEFFFSGVSVVSFQDFITAAGVAFAWSQVLFTTIEVFLGKLLQVQPTKAAKG